MNNGQIRDLCISLLNAETEDEVIALLHKADYWEDPTVWRHYGDVENNWGQGGNQQSLAEAALVEKIVNSVDARLLNECLERRIDPQRTRRAQEYPRSGLPFLRGRHWQEVGNRWLRRGLERRENPRGGTRHHAVRYRHQADPEPHD